MAFGRFILVTAAGLLTRSASQFEVVCIWLRKCWQVRGDSPETAKAASNNAKEIQTL